MQESCPASFLFPGGLGGVKINVVSKFGTVTVVPLPFNLPIATNTD